MKGKLRLNYIKLLLKKHSFHKQEYINQFQKKQQKSDYENLDLFHNPDEKEFILMDINVQIL